MTRVTQLIHDAGKYLLISVYPLPTHPTHNFTHKNGGNLETLPGWPKKLQHNRPARSAGQLFVSEHSDDGLIVSVHMSASYHIRYFFHPTHGCQCVLSQGSLLIIYQIWPWIDYYISWVFFSFITHPCPNIKHSLAEPPLSHSQWFGTGKEEWGNLLSKSMMTQFIEVHCCLQI